VRNHKWKNKRSPIQIMGDILGLLRLGQAGKTEIMYTVKLGFNQRQKYLENLVASGYVLNSHSGRVKDRYRLIIHSSWLATD
jgi:predicted transcriptional regulator